MKRFIISVMMVLMAYSCVMGQTILPFVQDGKVWVYEGRNYNDKVWNEIFSLEGDTIIGSRQCMKLYYTSDYPFGSSDHSYKGAISEEDGGNVFIIVPDSSTPVLLYDFSSESGTDVMVGEFKVRINERRLVKYRGDYLKVTNYSPYDSFKQDFPSYSNYDWIEGVGILGGATLTCFIDGYGPWFSGGIWELKTCTVNGEVVFNTADYNKTAQIVTSVLKSSVQPSDKIFYDLSGRKIDSSLFTPRSSLKKGIYIQNGKKVAVK